MGVAEDYQADSISIHSRHVNPCAPCTMTYHIGINSLNFGYGR
jgi:hypothetical protein